MTTMAWIAAVLLGVVLLTAAVAKLRSPAAWYAGASALGVSMGVARPVPYLEATLGALLLVQVQRTVVAAITALMLCAMTALVVRRLAQGLRPVCACFGTASTKPIGGHTVARNGVLLVLALVAAAG